MNVKAIVPLGLAAALGLVAMFMVRNAIAHRGGATVNTGNTVAVVVAKRDVGPGASLTRDDLSVARLPADSAPGQVFSSPDDLVGRVAQTPLVRGQAILETLLAPNGSGRGLQALVPAGYRAVTIEVNEYTGVGGMLEPGCRVDLVSVLRDDKAKEPIARTVLQNIKVTAIGRATAPVEPVAGQPLPPPANSVTILCTPAQVQTLELASMSGRPWLVLRSARDAQEVAIEGTTLSEMLGRTTDSSTADAGTATGGSTAGTPTTLPATTVMDTTPAPTGSKWTIRMIQGETESTQTFTLPAPPAAPATPRAEEVRTDLDPVIPDPSVPGSK